MSSSLADPLFWTWGAGANPGSAISVVEPAAILRMQHDIWGQGRLRPSRQLPVAELAQYEQNEAASWTQLVRPVSVRQFAPNQGDTNQAQDMEGNPECSLSHVTFVAEPLAESLGDRVL